MWKHKLLVSESETWKEKEFGKDLVRIILSAFSTCYQIDLILLIRFHAYLAEQETKIGDNSKSQS